MEWFLKEDGEAVFGEIGARPPGARGVDVMNFASDIDLYRGWASAVCQGTLGQDVERRYAATIVFKRAQGEGHIRSIEGLQSILARFGPHLTEVDLLPIGAHRRNWKQTLLSDGHVIVRHPDQQTCHEISDRVGTEVRQRTLLNLGRHFEVEQEYWQPLCVRLDQLLSGQPDLLPPELPDPVEEETQRILHGWWLVKQHFRRRSNHRRSLAPGAISSQSMWTHWNWFSPARSG